MPNPTEVGRRLREIRSQKQMTLRDVARRAGVSATLISDIERGKTSPTINSLSKISRALDEAIVHFIEEPGSREIAHTTRRDRVTVISDRGEVQMTSLSAGIASGKMDVIEAVYPAGSSTDRTMTHHGEKCGLVLEGELSVAIVGNVYSVRPGEAIHFRGTLEHSVSNIYNGETRVLWMTTPRLAVPLV